MELSKAGSALFSNVNLLDHGHIPPPTIKKVSSVYSSLTSIASFAATVSQEIGTDGVGGVATGALSQVKVTITGGLPVAGLTLGWQQIAFTIVSVFGHGVAEVH